MQLALKEQEIEVNLCRNARLTTGKYDVKRSPYSIDDLNTIFALPVYTHGERPTGGGGEAAYWLPLIALFAGPRLEEIGQLLVADIKCEENIEYFSFLDIDEEAEDAGTAGQGKSIKTNAGRRKVPIHPTLKDLGFLTFVSDARRKGQLRLFPNRKQNGGFAKGRMPTIRS